MPELSSWGNFYTKNHWCSYAFSNMSRWLPWRSCPCRTQCWDGPSLRIVEDWKMTGHELNLQYDFLTSFLCLSSHFCPRRPLAMFWVPNFSRAQLPDRPFPAPECKMFIHVQYVSICSVRFGNNVLDQLADQLYSTFNLHINSCILNISKF